MTQRRRKKVNTEGPLSATQSNARGVVQFPAQAYLPHSTKFSALFHTNIINTLPLKKNITYCTLHFIQLLRNLLLEFSTTELGITVSESIASEILNVSE